MTSSGLHRRVAWIGLVAGPLGAVAVYAVVPDAAEGAGLGHAGRATLGLMVWMAAWWLTEAIDVAATALLPVAVLPLLTSGTFDTPAAAVTAAASPYAHPLIGLFMGGFMVALAMERWGLHRRIALVTLRFVGTRPVNMIGGFMAVTAMMSMWVSNTATTAMMLPIAISVAGIVAGEAADGRERRRNFALCLMLGIAYAASIGGIGTLIGTPPNLLLAAFVESSGGREITFVRWLGVGLPLVVVFLPATWLLLTRVIFPVDPEPIEGGPELVRREHAKLGPMTRGEWATLVVFTTMALAWITRPVLVARIPPLAGLTDAGIAMAAALVLFVIPVDPGQRTFVMNWEWAKRLPWGILILFGGGLSLADAVSRHGVADYLGGFTGSLDALPAWLIVVAVTTGVIFLTELTSNTATTAALLPILAGVAPSLGLDPLLLLVPAAIAASCAFMMPVATPPNAIVFGSGHVTIPQMCRAGLWLNVLGVVLVTTLLYSVARPLLGIS